MKELSSISAAALAIAAMVMVSAAPAHAQGGGGWEDPSEQKLHASYSALGNPIKYLWSFETGFWEEGTLKIVDLMVKEGIANLQTVGEVDLAQQMQTEWAGVYADTLNQMASARFNGEAGTLDLGDHPPLFQWLANFTDLLNSKTRGIAGKLQIVADLTTVNYALPIVFTPHGAWTANYGDKAWVEYRLHFIPLSNVLTYWGALEGCNYASTYYPTIKHFCDPVAGKLEFYMGRYLSPRLSDWVFVKANPGTVIDDTGPTKPTNDQFSKELPSASDLSNSVDSDNGGQQ